MSYLLQEDPKYFFDVGGDNQQHRFHMGDCDGNFKIGKVIEDATTIEVKMDSYTLSTAKNFIHSVLRVHQKRLVQCTLCKIMY